MAIALVFTRGKQSADTVTTGNTTSVDSTGCDLIVAVRSFYQAITTPGLSDSKSNTWTDRTAYSSTNTRVIISYIWTGSAGFSVGASHTFTAGTSGASYPTLMVAGFSGAKTSADPYTAESGANTGGATSLAPGSVTPSEDNCLLVTGMAGGNSTGTPGGVTGYTIDQAIDFATTSAGRTGGLAHLIQTTAGATNPAWTFASEEAAAAIAVFKAAAGGGGGTNWGPMLSRGLNRLVQVP
jgi:hypothetical protein